MNSSRRRFRWLAGLALLMVIVAIGYVFRSRIARLPLVSRVMPRSETQPATDDRRAEPGSTPAPSAAISRGEVTIDPRRQQLIGVRTTVVKRTTVAPVVHAVGQVRYDETRLADVNVKVEGWIRDLRVDYTGQPVARGQALFSLYSPELLATQQEYLLALRTRDQLAQSTVPDARERAERLVAAARGRLRLWDISPDQIAEIERTRQAPPTVTFRSPSAGFVIEKQALQGMHVMAGQTLYRIADLSVVWVDAEVRENELAMVRVGQRANVTIDAYPDVPLAGRVTYIHPTVDEQTRTAKVRVELVNRGGRLKPGMYANVEVSAPAGTALVVPTNAVLDSGKEQIVFVAQGDGYFEPRRVHVGRRLEDTVEIVTGLKEGEEIATAAAFFLDSESQLRASLEGFAPTPSPGSSAGARQQLDITLRSDPDPPKTGENTFEVTVKDASGKPIADADVSLQFYMAAMPSMNMPAMRNTIKLPAAGGGIYRGTGEVMMAGRWDATITVVRQGQRLGAKQIAVVAR